MSKTVTVKVLKLLELDEFASDPPLVRLTCAAAVDTKSTAPGMKDKKEENYSFDATDPSNCLDFDANSDLVELSVAVVANDRDSGQLMHYPGTGSISISWDDQMFNKESEDITCPLYEDGNEIGVLIYRFILHTEASIKLNPASASPAVGGEDGDDFDAIMMADVDHLMGEDLLEDDKEMAVDAIEAENRDEKEEEVVGVEEEELVIEEQDPHEDDYANEHPEEEEDDDEEELVVIPNNDASLRDSPPSWLATADQTTNFVADCIRDDLASISKQCSKIMVRMHSLVCSSGRKLDTSTVTVKVGLLPLPGKITTLRSVPLKADYVPVVDDANTSTTTFPFALKTAVLSMGTGDLRSKTFKEGACPRLSVEISLGGNENYAAFGEMYLPSLLKTCSGQLVSVPLVTVPVVTSSVDGANRTTTRGSGSTSGGKGEIQSTLIFELNPDAAAAAAAATGASSVARTGTGSGAGSQTRGSAVVEASLCGVAGESMESCGDKLGTEGSIEAFLTCSGLQESLAMADSASCKSINSMAVALVQKLSMESQWPEMDILQLRLRNGPYPEDEIGRMCVPVTALLSHAKTQSKNSPGGTENGIVALATWKPNNSAKPGAFISGKCKIAGEFYVSNVNEAPTTTKNHNNQMESANWVEGSPEQLDLVATTGTVGEPARRSEWTNNAKPTVVKSAAGQLIGCLQGYISVRTGGGNYTAHTTGVATTATNPSSMSISHAAAAADVTGTAAAAAGGGQLTSGLDVLPVEEKDIMYYVKRGYSISAAVVLMPEGLRSRTPMMAAQVLRSNGSDVNATVEWNQGFHMFLAWAMQQRQVPYLQLYIYAEKGDNKTTTANSSSSSPGRGVTKSLIGSRIIDVSTLVSTKNAPIVKVLVPIGRTTTHNSILQVQHTDTLGWLVMGLQFMPAQMNADFKASVEAIEMSLKQTWEKLVQFPSLYCLGLSENISASMGMATAAYQLNPYKTSNCSMHVAVSNLDITAQKIKDELSDQLVNESAISLIVRVANDADTETQMVGRIENGGKVVWKNADAVVNFPRETSLSLCVFLYLVKGSNESEFIDPANILAETNLALGNDQLLKGLPMNFTVPFRDRSAQRSATLAVTLQLTSLGSDSAVLAQSLNSTSMQSTTMGGGTGVQPVPLKVEFCEGSIANNDGNSDMEPFFECSLLLPEGEEAKLAPNSNLHTKARTGFLRLTEDLESWGLDCLLDVPPTMVDALQMAQQMRHSLASAGTCTMAIVCRDASRQGCPEIGWVRLALTRQILAQGQTLEQWITLSPPTNQHLSAAAGALSGGLAGGGGHVATSGVDLATAKHSRMKIRISVNHADYDAAYAPYGLGSVLFRVVGVSDPRAGTDDQIVSANAAAYAWPNGSMEDSAAPIPEDFMFSQITARPVGYVNELSMFNEETLVGAVPVTGGFGEVNLRVKTFTANAAFKASFPIMASTTQPPAEDTYDPVLPPIPILNLNLTKEKTKKLMLKGNYVYDDTGHRKISVSDQTKKKQGAASAQQRSEPVLRLAAAYVPFVKGKLVLHCTGIKPTSSLSSHTPAGPHHTTLGSSPLSLRYLLGSNSARFMFSSPFALDEFSHAHTNNIAKALSHSANVTLMDVDTFELISHSIRRDEHFSMLPLFVSLLELGLRPHGQQACLGVGFVPTAALYYQAMRAAASSPMQDNAGSSEGTATGTSPWLRADVDIYDTKSREKVATVTLNLQFVMESVPEHVVRMIKASASKAAVDPAAKARIELGLKQSFVLADGDQSGAVSSAELLAVIMKQMKQRSSPSAATSKLSLGGIRPMPTGEIVGMENALELLLQLADVPTTGLEYIADEDLEEMVQKVFNQLDVDGDGVVSWWEWKSVLNASILGHNPDSKFMFPRDTLAIGLLAAQDALSTLGSGTTGSSTYTPAAGYTQTGFDGRPLGANSATSMFPYIKLRMVGKDGLDVEFPNYLDDGNENSSVFNTSSSKTVSRLQDMVKSLRLTNGIMAKRLEKAIATAQNLSIDLDAPGTGSQSKLNPPQQGGGAMRLSEIDYLEKRIRETEHQSESNLSSFLAAKNRSDILEAQLLELKSSQNILTADRHADSFDYNFNDQLEREIQEHSDNLKLAQEDRKLRRQETKNILRLRAVISKLLVPKVESRRRAKAAARLGRFVKTRKVANEYEKEKQAKYDAAVTIQRSVRGKLDRQKVQQMHEGATKTQNLLRKRKARRRVANMREEKAKREREARERELYVQQRQMQIRENCASRTISKHVRQTAERRRGEKDEAARHLQKGYRNHAERLQARRIVAQKRSERDARMEAERLRREEEARQKALELQRIMEEEKRNQAATTLQRATGQRANTLQGRKIRAFLAVQTSLFMLPRPDIHQALHYWIGIPDSMTTSLAFMGSQQQQQHQSNQTATTATIPAAEGTTFRHFGRGHHGRVEAVDVRSRIMDVLFLYNRTDGATKSSKAVFETVKLPYDHPLLDFYHTDASLKPPEETKGYLVNYNEHDDTHFLPLQDITSGRPKQIEETLGYKVGVTAAPEDASGGTGALYPGRVVGFNKVHKTVKIRFDAEDEQLEDDEENFAWDSESVVWLMPPIVARPATLEECVGFLVEVGSGHEADVAAAVEVGDARAGIVVGVDPDAHTLRVRYGHLNRQPDEEMVDWESAQVAWVRKVPLPEEEEEEKVLETPVKKKKQKSSPQKSSPILDEHGVPFSQTKKKSRPANIHDAVGHMVEVQSAEPGLEEPGLLHPGVVIGADQAAGTVRVLYEADRDDRTSSVDADEEGWITAGALGTTTTTTTTAAAGGTGGTGGGAGGGRGGEASPGPNEQEDADVEDLPWQSPNILWVEDGSEDAASRHERDQGDSVTNDDDTGSYSPRSSIAPRPKKLSDAIGHRVDVKSRERDAQEGDYFSGVIVGVNKQTQQVRVMYDGDGNIDDTEDLAWDCKDIYWLTEGSIASREEQQAARGGRPNNLAHCVGRPVALRRSADVNLARGKIVSYDPTTFTVHAAFSDENEDADPNVPVVVELNWKSSLLLWKKKVKTAAATTEPNTGIGGAIDPNRTRPINLADAKNWSVEIKSTEVDAHEDDVFVGKVSDVNLVNNTVRVIFAGEDGSLAEDDFEDMGYDSPLIRWVHCPPPAAITASEMGLEEEEEEEEENTRPDGIEEAEGWSVEVKSTEPDAHDDDVFVGQVSRIDAAKGQVRVNFVGEDGTLAEDDYDDLPFNSELIHWIRCPSYRPRTIEQSLDCDVELMEAEIFSAAAEASGRVAGIQNEIKGVVDLAFEKPEHMIVSIDWQCDMIDWSC